MKKVIIIIMVAVVAIAACRKKDVASFHGAANIYFNLDPTDSVLYTFALHPGKATDTAWVPVRISGDRENRDRVFAAKIIDSASTGIVNLQYQPLKDQYVLPAGAGVGYMPVILYNTDTMLFKRSFTLKLEMVPTGDFNSDISERVYTKVVYSNRLEKPTWWEKSPGGVYSIVKYQLFRIAATPDDVPTGDYSQPVQLYFTAKLQSLLVAADSWVNNNPDKGYVLTVRDSVNKDFYNPQAPDKKFLYKKDSSSGKYYFIDENNQQVK